MVLAAGVSTAVSATIGVTSLCISRVQPWSAFATLWSEWWIGDAMGDLVMAPLLLVWASRSPLRWTSGRIAEVVLLCGTLVAVSLVVFVGWLGLEGYPLHYTVFPFVIWGALRLGQRGTATVTFIASSLAIWSTVAGSGPFVMENPGASLIMLQLFMAVVAVAGLLLGAAMAERDVAERRRARDYAQLELNEAGLRLALQAGRMTVWDWDIPSGRLVWSASLIGLVPQELSTDAFETVWATVSFSRGLFGKKADPAYIEKVLRELTLWDKRNARIMELSGGMKRRVMIAKALSHEPRILFLDEPTAGVDVNLRKDMWQLVRALRDSGVTIILTTHYIEEAEQIADRIGIINKGRLVLVQRKADLMLKLGKKQLILELQSGLAVIPDALRGYHLELSADGRQVVYTYNAADFCRLHSAYLNESRHHSGIIIGDQQTISIGEGDEENLDTQ